MGYEKFLESKQIQFLVIKDWYQEEALLNYWADEIAKILKEEVKQDSFKVIFSAHSVPILPWIFGDPYIDQIFENSKLVAEKLGLSSEQYTNTWQSESDIGFHGLSQMFWSISENRQNIQTIIFLFLSASLVSILKSCLIMMWNVMICVRN